MELRQLFAINFRGLRNEKKISREHLAHDTAVDGAYLSRVEWAVTYGGLVMIGKLANIPEVGPAEFFRRASRSAARKRSE